MAKIDIGQIIDIAGVVKDVLHVEAKKNTNDLKPADVPKVAASVTPKIEHEVQKQVGAVVTNAVNAEPWYQSRVIIGTVVTLLATAAKIGGHELALVDQNSITDLVLQGGQVLGGLYALYGRLRAGLKPIGE